MSAFVPAAPFGRLIAAAWPDRMRGITGPMPSSRLGVEAPGSAVTSRFIQPSGVPFRPGVADSM